MGYLAGFAAVATSAVVVGRRAARSRRWAQATLTAAGLGLTASTLWNRTAGVPWVAVPTRTTNGNVSALHAFAGTPAGLHLALRTALLWFLAIGLWNWLDEARGPDAPRPTVEPARPSAPHLGRRRRPQGPPR